MSDLINRQSAIDAIEDYFARLPTMRRFDILRIIKDLPSVQPEVTEKDIKEYCQKRYLVVIDSELFQRMTQAQPERKKGMWNIIQGNIVVCSECGMGAPQVMTGCLINRHLEPNRTNFCSNCGAKMITKGGETDD